MGKKPPPEDTIRKKANLLARRAFHIYTKHHLSP
jgi:hypothetical protein